MAEPNFKKHTVEIDQDLLNTFREDNPGYSLKWFLHQCLLTYSRLRSENGLASLTKETFDETVREANARLQEGGST